MTTPPFPSAKGVLQVAAGSTQADGTPNNRKDGGRMPVSRLKLVVRRLAPGLTQQEFETALGDEWKAGKGKAAWSLYKPGKVSRDLSKPSRPSRAYIQVTEQKCLDQLAEKVRQTNFADARNTASDSVLLGPPVLEFAPYGRVPAGRRRADARQGTIDQDPEFINFLESLTGPIQKHSAAEDPTDVDLKKNANKVTPLIQHLRDKKAAKEKSVENKMAKHGKQTLKIESAEGREKGRSSTKPAKEPLAVVEKKSGRGSRIERVPKDALKATKQESVMVQARPKPTAESAAESAKVSSQEPVRKRATAAPSAMAAARMIQRDLGIRGRGGARRGGRDPPQMPAETTPADKNTGVVAAIVDPAAPSEAFKTTPTGPATMTRNEAPKVQAKSTAASQTPKSINAPVPAGSGPRHSKAVAISPGATQAFLKHANPSQGITEALLFEALAPFGATTRVEIDKRKGFAYADFAESSGLQNAVAASPIKVAQGFVQVLERKDRALQPPAPPSAGAARGAPLLGRGGRGTATPAYRGARGGSVRGRGGIARGGGPMSVSPTPAVSASAAVTATSPSSTNEHGIAPAGAITDNLASRSLQVESGTIASVPAFAETAGAINGQ